MRHKSIFQFYLFVIILTLSSCAEMVYKPLSDENKDTGFRYYNSSPYLLVYSNGKGGLVTQIIYLPDPNKKMTATPSVFMAGLQSTMEFNKGVLSNAKNSSDGTVVLSSVMKAVETAAPALLAALNEPAKDRAVPAPYLYKIIVKGSNIKFVGGKGDIDVNVNVLKQSEEKPS